MKEISFEIVPTYTCQYCRKEFERDGDILIIQNIQPLCSNECQIKVFSKTLKKYTPYEIKVFLSEVLPKYKPSSTIAGRRKLIKLLSLKLQELSPKGDNLIRGGGER